MKARFIGSVVSHFMPNTAKVQVTKLKLHPKIHKTVKVRKNYLVHDTMNAKVGDTVAIEHCGPISKLKRFMITEICKRENE
ncbi:ribosomal protein subunit S17 [Schizosaccharomyces japonicus yFS275]|uniref:Ribosomal protein subunit S17 n=1 Tax=Schizosaccharomyces japonicus (strain yFS275 / FY16936) TaxID=402676 RepID=B6K292_SCHJY|nr:ribosomal protein subunit S17 [Schizosaccharomyces japonicus yFS275]EEB07273.1 ribosomal protein subunit S17 [Schizosaccharomyces japonicus yFS275]